MDKAIQINGIEFAPGVVETIVSMAAAEVEGVAGVGSGGGAVKGTIKAVLTGKAAMPVGNGVEAYATEDGKIHVNLSVQVDYGCKLVDVAARVRSAVADAVMARIGVDVEAVDVNVDGVEFGEKRAKE